MISDKDRKQGNGDSRTAWHAFLVAAGIFLSRIAGLIRERAFAHYLGNSDAADAFKAAFRIPNFLQNLFGEGVLSASFIPVGTKRASSVLRSLVRHNCAIYSRIAALMGCQ